MVTSTPKHDLRVEASNLNYRLSQRRIADFEFIPSTQFDLNPSRIVDRDCDPGYRFEKTKRADGITITFRCQEKFIENARPFDTRMLIEYF